MALLPGCGEQEPIRVFKVPKPHVLDAAAREAGIDIAEPADPADPASDPQVAAGTPARMIGAIVPHGDESWFFKLTGPEDAVAEREDEVLAILKSVRFGDDGKPTWNLPDDWQQLPGSQLRFATLRLPGDRPIEMSVMSLPTSLEDYDEYVLINVNRWRGQLGLPATTRDRLLAGDDDSGLQRIEQEDVTMYVVNFSGTDAGAAGAMAGRPSLPADHPPVGDRQPGSNPRASASGSLTFTTPSGWTEGQNDAISRYAFDVQDAGQMGRMTITAAGGDLPANINRWRLQLGLPAWSAAEMGAALEQVTVGGEPGYVVTLKAEGDDPQRKALLGAIVPTPSTTWFFKLTGPAALIESQHAPFESFLQSVKFE